MESAQLACQPSSGLSVSGGREEMGRFGRWLEMGYLDSCQHLQKHEFGCSAVPVDGSGRSFLGRLLSFAFVVVLNVPY